MDGAAAILSHPEYQNLAILLMSNNVRQAVMRLHLATPSEVSVVTSLMSTSHVPSDQHSQSQVSNQPHLQHPTTHSALQHPSSISLHPTAPSDTLAHPFVLGLDLVGRTTWWWVVFAFPTLASGTALPPSSAATPVVEVVGPGVSAAAAAASAIASGTGAGASSSLGASISVTVTATATGMGLGAGRGKVIEIMGRTTKARPFVTLQFGDELMIRAKHGLLERQSLENMVRGRFVNSCPSSHSYYLQVTCGELMKDAAISPGKLERMFSLSPHLRGLGWAKRSTGRDGLENKENATIGNISLATVPAPGGLTRHRKSCSHWQQQLMKQSLHFKRASEVMQGAPAAKKIRLGHPIAETISEDATMSRSDVPTQASSTLGVTSTASGSSDYTLPGPSSSGASQIPLQVLQPSTELQQHSLLEEQPEGEPSMVTPTPEGIRPTHSRRLPLRFHDEPPVPPPPINQSPPYHLP
ncbi:hypothetical protein F4604DRAFT_1987168 [Suillus subluteus]|nr:hypothetical protein F4604DRAFT_1987168 [Suillus subluteus]